MINKLKNIKLSNWLVGITSFYIAGSIIQNLLAVKTFGTPMIAITTGGTLISWLVFACSDIITEVWGKKRSIQTFTAGAIANILLNIICWISISLPSTNDFVADAYKTVLGTNWRIALASIIAFLIGNYVNTSIMHNMRVHSKDENKTFGYMCRAILSTLFGQLLDNGIFYLVAFSPIGIPNTVESPWNMILQLVIFTTCLETITEAIISPYTAKFTRMLKSKRN